MTGKACTFREADDDSTGRIAEIYNQYIGKTTMDIEEKTSQYFQSFIRHKEKTEKLFIAELDDTVLGYGIIKRYSDREGYKFTAETSIYVDEKYTGRGFGSILQTQLIKEAKALGLKHLVAKIWASNLGSIKFHEKHGYEIVGTQKNVGFVGREWKDVTIMQFLLG